MRDKTQHEAEIHTHREIVNGTQSESQDPRRESVRRKVTIRRLNASDSIHEVTFLLHRAYKELADMGIHNPCATQDVQTTRQRIEKGECWVAILGGRIVGTIVFVDAKRTRGCWWYNRPGVAHWYQFAVDPDFQRLGIGSMLLHTAEQRAVETGALELAGTTAVRAKHLIAMYRRKGFNVVGYLGWLSRNYSMIIISKYLLADGFERRLWSRILRKGMVCGSWIAFRAARSSDDTCRSWVRILQKVRA